MITVEWLPPWMPVPDDGTARNLERELARELSPGHPLYGIMVAAIGLGGDGDDVAFQLLDGSGRFAVVHLTWGSGPETPPWPHTTLFDDEADWMARGMRPDSEEP